MVARLETGPGGRDLTSLHLRAVTVLEAQ
jgi:hypothetical protein